MPHVSWPSMASNLVYAGFNQEAISTATGFVVERSGAYFLVTNWHVATGMRAADRALLDQPGGRRPDELRAYITNAVAGGPIT